MTAALPAVCLSPPACLTRLLPWLAIKSSLLPVNCCVTLYFPQKSANQSFPASLLTSAMYLVVCLVEPPCLPLQLNCTSASTSTAHLLALLRTRTGRLLLSYYLPNLLILLPLRLSAISFWPKWAIIIAPTVQRCDQKTRNELAHWAELAMFVNCEPWFPDVDYLACILHHWISTPSMHNAPWSMVLFL